MKPPEAVPSAVPMTRRVIIKKAAYVTPRIVTFPIVPTFAKAKDSKEPKTRHWARYWKGDR